MRGAGGSAPTAQGTMLAKDPHAHKAAELDIRKARDPEEGPQVGP